MWGGKGDSVRPQRWSIQAGSQLWPTPEHEEYLRNTAITPGRETITGRALLERTTVHVEDIVADPEYALAVTRIGGTRTMLGVPLLYESEPVGVLVLTRPRVQPFAQRQIDFVATFADQAAIAIENARLVEDLQARTRELSAALEQQTATSEVLQVISRSNFDLQTVLDTLVELAARLCEADSATIAQQRGPRYHRTAVYGFSSQATAYLKDSPVEWDRGSGTGRTLIEAKVVHIPDVDADPEYTWTAAKEVGRFRAMLGVPLLREGTTIGALVLTRQRAEPFTDKQIELVTTFADQAVIAIENVRLFEEVQARTCELQEALEYQTATSDILEVISRSPSDIRPVLDRIVEVALRLCEADDAVIFLREGELLKVAAHEGQLQLISISARSVAAGFRVGLSLTVRQSTPMIYQTRPTNSRRARRCPALWCSDLLSSPLFRDGVAVGAILVRRAEVRPFSEKHIAVRNVCNQAVIAIENARLFDEVQARTAELQDSAGTSDCYKPTCLTSSVVPRRMFARPQSYSGNGRESLPSRFGFILQSPRDGCTIW